MALIFDPKTGFYHGSDYINNSEIDQDYFRALFQPQKSLSNIHFFINFLDLDPEEELREVISFGITSLYLKEKFYD